MPLSVPPLRCRLMQWSCICGLATLAGDQLRATETEISAALWALIAWEGLYFYRTVNKIYSEVLVKNCKISVFANTAMHDSVKIS